MTITKQIGRNKYVFSFEGENLFECVQASQKLSFNDVPKCGRCGSDALVLRSHKAQNKFEYTTINCLKCRASVTFGQTQEDKTYFLRRDEQKNLDWRAFEGKTTATPPLQPTATLTPVQDDWV